MHKLMQITPYHAKYFAFELTKRSSSDSLQKLASSLLDAQVDLNPHQVEAALFAFHSPLSKGAILADEVGLGKTIEAGLVISQKWAERKRKILVIVPSNLRKQWNQELLDKFFLSSLILETPSFNQEIKKGNLNPFNQHEIIICSYHFARAKDVYIKNIPWDLVVIDEAHRLRNVYKPSNKIATAVKNAVAHAPKMLLTATPLQNSLLELYGLVSIIDDYTFGDLKSYKNQFARLANENDFHNLKERLKPICIRTFRRQVLEYVKYTNRMAITQEFVPSPDEQRLYDLVSAYLQRENLFALPPSQRQLMTLILRKLLASSTFAISGTLDALAIKLENIVTTQGLQEDIEQIVSQDFESYDEIKDEWEDAEEENQPVTETEEELYTSKEIKDIKKEINDLKEFQHLARSITRNSKGEVLLTALKKGFAEIERLGGNKKAIIFTESTRTQEYLNRILGNTDYKDRIVLFNGSNNDQKSKEIYKKWLEKHLGTDRITGSKSADKRAAIVDYFREEYPITLPSGRVVNPPESRCWVVSENRYEELVKDNRIWFGSNGNNVPSIKRFLSEVQEGTVSKTIWFRTEVGDNQEAKKEIKAFDSEDVFTTPKPERLIQRILTLATNPGDWVLDSFLGSGTTAAVAHKMGRRWIGIELGEHCHTHCLPRLRKVIDGTDQGGISRIVPTPYPSQEGNKQVPSSEGKQGWVGGGGFKYYYLAPSLLKKDKHGNWIIDERYNADMLAAAMAKHEGFRYCPDEHVYWKQGRSTEKDYIFITTQFVTVQFLDKIHEEMKPDESLLICCKSFQEACENRYAAITIKKIPKMLLGRCEFGKEDYSLNIVNLPEPTPDPSQEGNLEKDASKDGNTESPLSGGDLGVGKSGRAKKPDKDNSTGKNAKQRKLFK